MLKKINLIIVSFFGILTINLNLGYAIFLPLIIFYLLKDRNNIYYIYIPSIISCFVFARKYVIAYLGILCLISIFYFILTSLTTKKTKLVNKTTYIIMAFILIINLTMAYIFKIGPLTKEGTVNHLATSITCLLSIAMYYYLKRYLYKMLLDTYDNLNLVPSSLCYLEILIAIIAVIGSTTVSILDINLGLILGTYFAMYFGRSYKNIYAIIYSVIIMLILLIGYNIKESIFIPFIGALYFVSSIYLMLILNAFLTILVFVETIYTTNNIISLMATSIFFEIVGYFIIKERPSEIAIFEDIHEQIQKNTTNEILNFATFLDKFAINFKNSKEYNEKLNKGIQAITQTHCKTCTKMKECFNKYQVELYPIFKEILSKSDTDKTLYPEFYEYCPVSTSIIKTAKLINPLDTSIDTTNNHMLISQINGVSSSIRKYVVDLTSKQEMSYYQLLLIKKRLIDYGYDISYFEIKRYFDHDFLILLGLKEKTFNDVSETITLIVEKTINQKVSLVLQNEERSTIYINIIPKLQIDIVYGYGAISCEGLDICGDNYLIKEFDNGHFISAISDGMGKGYSAFYESDMTLKLVSEIIELNVEASTALEILNTYYVIQDYLERYATLDFLEINRYTSLANFYKLGATTTYIFKANGTIERIINKSLPFGLEEEIDNSEYRLENDDLILMSSDGIFENLIDTNKLETFIEKIHSFPPQKIVYEILNYAISNKVKTKDDMSVIALKIKSVA